MARRKKAESIHKQPRPFGAVFIEMVEAMAEYIQHPDTPAPGRRHVAKVLTGIKAQFDQQDLAKKAKSAKAGRRNRNPKESKQ